MNNNKAFLITPPTGLYVRDDRCQSSIGDFAIKVIRPPSDLMMIAAVLESLGFTCSIKDYPVEGGTWDTFKKDIAAFNPGMLIISATTPTLANDMLACGIAKQYAPAIITIAKGAHFLANDIQTLKEFAGLDIVIRGEIESTIKEIASAKEYSGILGITYRCQETIKRNPDRPFLENLDSLPLPARHLINNRLYTRPDTTAPMAVIETSRGCPGNCIFCLVNIVAGKRIRMRSSFSVANEIEDCMRRFKITNFHFKSDTFTWNKDWVIELCNEIIKRKLNIQWLCNSRVDTLDRQRIECMKRAGCWAIALGAEHGSQTILNKIKKGITLEQSAAAIGLCKEFAIKAYTYFIFGFPWDTEETINETIDFAIKLDGDFADFSLPYPFPGTELEQIARGLGLIERQLEGNAYSQPIIPTLSVSRQRLVELRKKALKKFYLRLHYISKQLYCCNSPKVSLQYLKYGAQLFNKLLR